MEHQKEYPWLDEIKRKYDRRYKVSKKKQLNKTTAPPNYPSVKQQYYNLKRSYEEHRIWPASEGMI